MTTTLALTPLSGHFAARIDTPFDELLDEAERQAEEIGIVRLFTEASELARPAFQRAGYRVVHRRDFEVDGVPLHNFAMEKLLA